jgi:hypothetical protein
MAKAGKSQGNAKITLNDNIGKGTSIGRGLTKTSSMNKNKRRSFKKYRGQG